MNENEEFVKEFLEECAENLDVLDQDLVALEKEPRDAKRLESIFRTIHTIKGTSGFFAFAKLSALAHDGESLLGRLRDGELVLNQEIATALLNLVDAIRAILANIQNTGAEGEGDHQELSARLIRLTLGSAIEPAVEDTPEETAGEAQVETTAEDAAEEPAEFGQATAGGPATSAAEGSIRVDVRLLDKLMDLAGELVLARNQLNQFSESLADKSLRNTIQRLGLITSELQEGVMQTRMQPMTTIWGKFPRVIRDLAVACGKDARLDMEGEETELDRSLLETIKDPLTHLIRNAVDHGIELPKEREARGKPRRGRVLLRAYHESGQVVIEIIDDGGGIDVERVKQRAVERRLLTPDKAAAMSDKELAQLIFRPGFSTAEQVTDLSGRGVGMDVVKTNMEKIGGTIELQNRPGSGTTVRIRIPLTLAIIPALIATSSGQRFAIPQVNVLELLNYADQTAVKAVEWVHDAPVHRLRGELLPLLYLNHVLETDDERPAVRKALNIVVLQAEGRRFGLVVDQVINTEEIVVKPLGSALKSIPIFAGATIMGDAAVVLILDVAGLARQAGMTVTKVEPALDAAAPAAQRETVRFVLCQVGLARRVAVPLSEVERLERIPVDTIERTIDNEVVQYGGEVMPLVRLAELWGNGADDSTSPSTLMLLVHQFHGRNVGLVVSHILDIVESPQQFEQLADAASPDTASPVVGSLVLEGRATDVIDLDRVCRAADLLAPEVPP